MYDRRRRKRYYRFEPLLDSQVVCLTLSYLIKFRHDTLCDISNFT